MSALRLLRPSLVMATAFALLFTDPARSCEFFTSGFTLIHPWAEATDPGATDAPVYFKLESVTVADRLVSVHTPIAQSVELRPGSDPAAPAALALEVPINDAVGFEPGDPHLMLRGLKTPLQWGRSYEMTLTFEKAGPVAVMVSVGAH